MTHNAADATPPVLAAAEVVAGRYRVERLLGREPAVESYVVTDLLEQRQLLLKLLVPPSSAPAARAGQPGWQLVWQQQMAALMGLRHPAIAQLTEARIDEATGRAWLVREPVELEGQPLREVLAARRRAFTEPEAVALVTQIGEALEAAHQIGLCHRCLTPARVFLIPDGALVRVRVADFALLPPGWVRACAEPGYLAPEQITPVGGPPGAGLEPGPALASDRRADQFALAVILYELLAGQPAFLAAVDEPREQVLSRIVNEDPLPLSLSRAVELSLSRALSRSPAVRFPSVRELVRGLGGDISRWPSVTVEQRAVRPLPPVPRRIFLPMATGALIALVGLGSFAWVQRLRERPRPGPADLQPAAARTGPDGVSPGELPDGPDARPALAARTNGDGGTGPESEDLAPSEVADFVPELPDSRPRAVASTDAAAGLPPTSRWPRGLDRSIPPLLSATAVPVAPGAQAPGAQAPGAQAGAQAGPALGAPRITVSDGELSAEQRADLLRCVRIAQPSRAYRVTLDNIAGRLLVAGPSSPEFSSSQDFRDCLKLGVRGTLVPKVVTITGTMKGRSAP